MQNSLVGFFLSKPPKNQKIKKSNNQKTMFVRRTTTTTLAAGRMRLVRLRTPAKSFSNKAHADSNNSSAATTRVRTRTPRPVSTSHKVPDLLELYTPRVFRQAAIASLALSGGLAYVLPSVGSYVVLGSAVLFAAAGVRDLRQKQHTVLRNFPVLGRLRYLLEGIGPGAYFFAYAQKKNTTFLIHTYNIFLYDCDCDAIVSILQRFANISSSRTTK